MMMIRSQHALVTLFTLVVLMFSQFSFAAALTDPTAIDPVPESCEYPPHCRRQNDVVYHNVFFQFCPEVSRAEMLEVASAFFALKRKCVRPGTQYPYIVSVKGGKDQSIEDLNEGLEQGFVVELCSLEDRDYYVNIDPAHQAFKAYVKNKLVKTITVDYQNGVFEHCNQCPEVSA